MRLETRVFQEGKKEEVIIFEFKEESELVDWALGRSVPGRALAEVGLADGYGEYYVRLTKVPVKPPGGQK